MRLARPLLATIVIVACSGHALAAQQSVSRPVAIPRDHFFWSAGPVNARAVFEQEIMQALLVQREAWKSAERVAHSLGIVTGKPTDLETQRRVSLHCHVPGTDPVAYAKIDVIQPNGTSRKENSKYAIDVPTQIRGVGMRAAVCPIWLPPRKFAALPGVDPEGKHEYGPRPLEPARLAPFPPTLISGLDSAAHRYPKDPWFIGQLIRMLTENGAIAAAARAVAACDANDPWCGMLHAYVSYESGNLARADSEFQSIAARAPVSTRCQWMALRPFTPIVDCLTCSGVWCDDREDLNRRMWWLATPFFSDGANFRRAAHMARYVRNSLVMPFPVDAHYDLRASIGSDAIVAMRLRYGWATHQAWGGVEQDSGHTMYLGHDASPYSAPEYSRRNVSTFASDAATSSPYAVTDDDYFLGVPTDTSTVGGFWPSELFLHPGGTIIRLPQQQRAFLRRDNSPLLLVATDLHGGLVDSIGNDPVNAALVYSPIPDSVQILDRRTAHRGDRIVLHGNIQGAGIAGLEYHVNSHGLAGGRTRFGVTSPPTLAAVTAGHCAISDPILVQASALTGNGVNDAFAGMLGSLALSKPRKVGVMWESYGFAATDSVALTVRVVRLVANDSLRRAGIATSPEEDVSSSFKVAWHETSIGRGTAQIAASVPTFLRELTVDVSRLHEGDYTLRIEMQKTGCDLAHSERDFSILR